MSNTTASIRFISLSCHDGSPHRLARERPVTQADYRRAASGHIDSGPCRSIRSISRKQWRKTTKMILQKIQDVPTIDK
jgi:hypothetical protein